MSIDDLNIDSITITPRKPAIYIRISTLDQNTASQEQQLVKWLAQYKSLSAAEIELMRDDPEELRRWMNESATWYVDRGTTGDNLDRPQFELMQKAIAAGEHDTVIVWKIDRLSRKMVDGLAVLSDWLERGVNFISTTQAIDLRGPMGKMIAALLLGVAEMEQETRRERQAAGIEAAKKNGTYERAKKKSAASRLGQRKRKPERARELRDQGLKPDEIARSMGINRATVYRYLKECED